MNKTKTLAAVALGMVLAISMSSCKSKESLYKKAYEKAQAQNTRVTEDPNTVNVTPVQPVAPPVTTVTTETTETTVAPVTDVSVRSEALQVVDGDGLKAYSVVCGAFSLKANADPQEQRLPGTDCTQPRAQTLQSSRRNIQHQGRGNPLPPVAARDIPRRMAAI